MQNIYNSNNRPLRSLFVIMDNSNQQYRKLSYEKPKVLEIKKWILSVFIFINILALVHYSIYVVQITDNALHNIVDMKPEEYAYTTKLILCIVVFLIAFTIVIQLVFLYGIYKENLLLTVAYFALISMATSLSILKSLYDPYFWTNTIWFAVTAVMSLLYLLDLRTHQQNIMDNQYM